MKKLVLALLCLAALAGVTLAAEGAAKTSDAIDGVWGMKFGISCEEADKIMTDDNGAVLLCQYRYLPGYSEAFYKANFFGREGHVLLRFSPKGLFLARFAFVRTESLKSEMNVEEEAPRSSEKTVIDARAIASSSLGGEKKKPASMELSAHFNELKSMLFSKYGSPSEILKIDGLTAGYSWKSGAFYRSGITLYENRSLSRNDTVLTYEDRSRR